MNVEWVSKNLIYLTKHGSQAYGTNTDLSDLDLKGIVIPPLNVEYNLFNRTEQVENHSQLHQKYDYLKNPKNPKIESVIYSLRKIFILAANVNPNCIEILFTDPSDHLITSPTMIKIFENRNLFLSSKAKFTHSGFAFSQLAKIERHRKWIVLGDIKDPKREDFGLPMIRSRQLDEIFGYIKSEVEKWNLSKFSLDETERNDLKETMWDLISEISKLKVGWDNWPSVYEAGIVQRLAEDLNLKDEIVDLLNKERQFKKAKEQYLSWLNWKNNRNPERHKLEVKSGYDTKHASQLVRLLRVGYEIISQGKVIVKRPDAEELLAIKNGAWTYNKIIEYANEMQSKLDDAYKITKLPKSVDFQKINNLYHELFEQYWNNRN